MTFSPLRFNVNGDLIGTSFYNPVFPLIHYSNGRAPHRGGYSVDKPAAVATCMCRTIHNILFTWISRMLLTLYHITNYFSNFGILGSQVNFGFGLKTI